MYLIKFTRKNELFLLLSENSQNHIWYVLLVHKHRKNFPINLSAIFILEMNLCVPIQYKFLLNFGRLGNRNNSQSFLI